MPATPTVRIEPVGTRVRLDQGAGYGTIMGHMLGKRPSEGGDDTHLWYVVELDGGFWSADRKNFVTLLVVHADAIHRLLDEWLAEDN